VFCVLLYRWWVKYVDFVSVFRHYLPHNSRDTLLLPFSCVSIVEILVLRLYKFTGPACPHFMNSVHAYVCLFFFLSFFFGWEGVTRFVFVNHSHGHTFLVHMMCYFLKHSSLVQNRIDRMIFVWSSSFCKYVGMELCGDQKGTQPIL